MINKLKRYLRYHHYFSHPAKESHSTFISVLSWVEEYSPIPLGEARDMDEGWKQILYAVNQMPDEQVKDVLQMITNSKQVSKSTRKI